MARAIQRRFIREASKLVLISELSSPSQPKQDKTAPIIIESNDSGALGLHWLALTLVVNGLFYGTHLGLFRSAFF
jgi:hypothetical protein